MATNNMHNLTTLIKRYAYNTHHISQSRQTLIPPYPTSPYLTSHSYPICRAELCFALLALLCLALHCIPNLSMTTDYCVLHRFPHHTPSNDRPATRNGDIKPSHRRVARRESSLARWQSTHLRLTPHLRAQFRTAPRRSRTNTIGSQTRSRDVTAGRYRLLFLRWNDYTQ